MLALGVSALLAVMLGVALANPTNIQTIIWVGATIGFLSIPMLMRHHQFLLVACVNAPLIAFFLPGNPDLWVFFAFFSLGASLLAWAVNGSNRPQWDMRVGWPLLILLMIVISTAMFRGGVTGRALGSGNWGGMRYVLVVSAIAAFFAISARSIQAGSANRFGSFYFLSGSLSFVSNLILIAGPSLYFLFSVFSSELAYFQLREGSIQRYTGLALAAAAIMNWLLMKYGIRGLTSFGSFWRIFVFALFLGVGLLGGFRSTLILLMLLLAFQFAFERLYRGWHIVALVGTIALSLAMLVMFIERLPISIQRSLSFLPIKVDPIVKADADGTLDWRLEMWKVVLPEVPKYLWIGKGYSYSGVDYYLTKAAVSQGRLTSYEDTLISGNYHHGILTLIIPFGLFGFLAFMWFAVAGWWLLFNNYRRSRPEVVLLNTFLLSYYSARLLFYFTFYGQFDLDLIVFTSCVALSLAINRGWQGTHPVEEARKVERVAEKG
jgi:hypothetical protein